MLLFAINPVLIAAAVIPAVVLLVYVYKKDKLESEPSPMLLSLVLYGVLATFLAMMTERLLGGLIDRYYRSGTAMYNFLMYFLVVGLSEEGFKYLLLKRRTWRSPAFNCQFDGVVYAVFVSLGFALWENIGYVAMYGFSTAMVRAVTAVPGHACFGVFMGVWYGAARRYEYAGLYRRSRTCRWMALLLPALLHGAYDTIASSEGSDYGWVFVVFVLLMFAAAYIAVKKAAAHDRAF